MQLLLFGANEKFSITLVNSDQYYSYTFDGLRRAHAQDSHVHRQIPFKEIKEILIWGNCTS